jgi:hypothetical protein
MVWESTSRKLPRSQASSNCLGEPRLIIPLTNRFVSMVLRGAPSLVPFQMTSLRMLACIPGVAIRIRTSDHALGALPLMAFSAHLFYHSGNVIEHFFRLLVSVGFPDLLEHGKKGPSFPLGKCLGTEHDRDNTPLILHLNRLLRTCHGADQGIKILRSLSPRDSLGHHSCL